MRLVVELQRHQVLRASKEYNGVPQHIMFSLMVQYPLDMILHWPCHINVYQPEPSS